MPDDLISRAESKAAVEEAMRYYVREERAGYITGVRDGLKIASILLGEVPPAEGPQVAFDALMKQIEAWMSDADNTEAEASAYGDASYAIGRFAMAVGLEYRGPFSSPPAVEQASIGPQRARPLSQAQLRDTANQAREAVERAGIEAKETCEAIDAQVAASRKD